MIYELLAGDGTLLDDFDSEDAALDALSDRLANDRDPQSAVQVYDDEGSLRGLLTAAALRSRS